MKIRKTYHGINPELLNAEIRDFALKQGVTLGTAGMETYTLPDQSADFISRGTLTFTVKNGSGEKECLRAHIVGSTRGETKMMLDIDEALFTREKLLALQEDLDFIFSPYEVK